MKTPPLRTLLILFATIFTAQSVSAATFRWAGSSNRIYVEGGGSATLTDIKTALPSAPLDLVDAGNKVWLLRANILIAEGSVLILHGVGLGGDVNELRLQSLNSSAANSFVSVIADYGGIDIRSTKIISWNTSSGSPDTEYASYGRAFMRVRSRLATDGVTPLESRMDIADSEIGYLGYYAAESYGLVWKVIGSQPGLYDLVQVRGNILNSRIHHNYFGVYTYGAQDCQWLNNELDHNVGYGFDPHDDSDNLLIEGNNSHHNGNHGIIASRRCDHLTIRNNLSWANAGNGIMLHRHCHDTLVENNQTYLNEDSGVALFDTDRALVRNNLILSNSNAGVRISVGAADNRIENNEIGFSGKYGVYFYGGSDPAEPDPDDPTVTNRLRRNQLRNNFIHDSEEEGIKLADADETEFSGNTFSNNGSVLRFTQSTLTRFANNSVPPGVTVKVAGSSSVPSQIYFNQQPLIDLELDQYSAGVFEDDNNAVFDLSQDLFTLCTSPGAGGRSSLVLTSAQIGSDAVVATRKLFASPQSGTLLVNPTVWTLGGDWSKEWKAQSTVGGAIVSYSVGDLAPGGNYSAFKNGALLTSFTADASGYVSFSTAPGTTAAVTYSIEAGGPPPNAPPSVQLTSPLPGASVVSGTAVTLSADASDPDGSVAQVVFYADGLELGSDSSAPYSLLWTPATGTYQLTAVATDNQLASTTSAPVSLLVLPPVNVPPTVELTSPSPGVTVVLGTLVTLSANALDADGSITQVVFYAGGVELNVDTTAPYAFDWTPGLGTYVLTAAATDNSSATVVSAPISLTVLPPSNVPPTVQVTSPSAGTSVPVGTVVTLSANASDSDGSVGQVAFRVDGVPVGVDGTAPYSVAWTAVPGIHQVTAVATDNQGAPGTSPAVSITVTSSSGTGPFLESGGLVVLEAEHFESTTTASGHAWTASTAVAGFTGEASMQATPNSGMTISANVTTTSPVLVYQAQFVTTGNYNLWIRGWAASGSDDSVYVSVDGQAPQSVSYGATGVWTWRSKAVTIAGAGVHTINVWMREDGAYVDRVLLSSNLSFIPTGNGPAESPRSGGGPQNIPPTVQVTSPLAGTSVPVGTVVTLSADAVDGDGTVGQVAFYVDSVPVGVDGTAPYSVAWTAVPGIHQVTAVATDNQGAPGTSPAVSITVTSSSGTGPFLESGGLVVMEAEHFESTTTASGHAWTASAAVAGFTGDASMQAAPNSGMTISANVPTTSPVLVYQAQFVTTGNYNLWIRGWAASGSDDSVYVSVDGQAPQSVSYGATGAWTWRSKAVSIVGAGVHTINVWMREDGAYVDRVLLSSNLSFIPTGNGPAESSR